MNKIFKILFNKRTNSFVVASELANSNGKASSTTDERKSTPCSMPSKFATLLVFSSAMLASQAFAGSTLIGAFSSGTVGASGTNAVAIGEGAIASGKDNAIAIGAQFHANAQDPSPATASGDNSIAIGQGSLASTTQSVAIGQFAKVKDTATQSIAIGANTEVTGASSIAIGSDDANGTDYHFWKYDTNQGKAVNTGKAAFEKTLAEGSTSIAIGTKTIAKADGSIAFGVVSTAGGKESISIGAKTATKGTNAIALGTAASGVADNSIALGTDAVTESAYSVAIGNGATVAPDLEGAVVLGHGSTATGSADEVKTTTEATVGNYSYGGFAGTVDSKGDLVSVGTKGQERKIINVAAGEISDKSTEAINGSQLFSLIKALDDGEVGPTVYTDEDGNRLAKANNGKYYPTNQVGADGQPLAGATAVDNPILSVVNPDGTTAKPTTMGNVKSTVGLDSAAGKPIDAATAQTNVGNLLEAKDGLNNAATVGDLQALAQAGLDFTGNNNTDTVHRALGTKLAIEGEGSWDGTNSAADNLFVQADPNNNKLVVKMNQALTGLTSVETTDGNGNVAKLTPAGTEVTDANGNTANYGANGLTVKDANGNTAISLASTNGTSSLNFAMDSNGNGTGKITGIAPGKISANSTDVVTGGQLYTLQNNVKNLTTGLNNKLNNLNAKVNRNNRQLRGGIATVTAMTNIPQVTFAGKSAVGIGVGTYENEGAVSVGYSRMSDNGRVILKISAGASTEDTFNAGAGVAFQW